MGKPDKMKIIGHELGSLAVLKRPEYKKDLMEMDEEELRGALLDYKLALKEGASKEDIVEQLLDAGFTTEDVPENEEDNSTKEAKPVEEVKEAQLRVVQSPTIAETEERIQKLKEEIADNIVRGEHQKVYSNQEKFQVFGEHEEEINGLVSARRAAEPSLGRRRALSEKPFPSPRPRGEGTKAAPQKPEVAKPVAEVNATVPLATVLEGRTKLLDKEDLGRRSETKEDNTKTQIEQLAQKLYKNEELTKSEREFILAHPEVQKRLGELYGNEVTPQTSPEPAPEVEAAAATPEKEPAPVRENGLNGNVEFQLGKLGIIDASDPKKYEENKALAIENIKREIPNFFKLSPEQQGYCLDKLRQKVRHDLDVGVKEELNQIKGWKRLFSGFRAGGIHSRLAKETKEGGLSSYKENLKDITNFVEMRGLDVETTEKGMVLKFLSRETKDPKHKEIVAEFNRAATALAEIPYDKTLDDRTPLQVFQKKKYEKALKVFQDTKIKLLHFEVKDLTKPENANFDNNKIVLELSGIEDDIRMNQALTYNQEATSWIGQKIQKWGIAEKAVIGATGFATRGLAKYAAGFGGGLVASAVLGGAMGRVRKGQEFQRIASDKRYGEFIKAEEGEKGLVKEKRAGVREFIDSRGYADRLNKLIDKIENTPPGEKRDALLQSLENRVVVARERDESGLVRFGNTKDELKNKFAFIDALKRATGVTRDAKVIWEAEKVAERLNNIYFQDKEKTSAREKEMKKAFWRGARNGALIFIGGFEVNDLLFHNGGATKEMINNLVKADNKLAEFLGAKPIELPFEEPQSVRMNPTPVTAGQSANFPENMPRPDSLPYDINNMPPTPLAESSFGARGAIGAIKDLQRALIDQYGGNMPENLKSFVGENPDRLAIKWNMFKPEFRDESIALPKGTKFLALPDGNISIKLPDGKILGITNPTENMQFDYFDSGAKDVAPGVETTVNNQNPLAGGRTVEGVYNPEGAASGVPENVPGDPNNIRPGYDFERVKTGLENLGFRHEAVEGGDIFSADVPTGDAPEMVEGYANIDGLKVDTKEIKGTIDFLYDSKGVIKNVDLPALQVEDVSRFRANPENFIGGSHDVAERAILGKKLMTMNSQVETFLKYRRIMEIQSLNPDSPEYRFLHEESNKLWSAIQKKVEYQFNPDYNGFRANPIENTAPMVEVPPQARPPLSELIPGSNSNESVPVVRSLDVDGPSSTSETPQSESRIATPEDLARERALEEAHSEEGLHKEGGKPEIVRTNRDVIPSDSILLQESFVSKYGGVESVDKNVVFFKDGHVGFYAESLKQGIAKRSAQALASANAENLGINMNRPPVPVATQIPGGPVRYLLIYEKTK